jgi:hypothetical protein
MSQILQPVYTLKPEYGKVYNSRRPQVIPVFSLPETMIATAGQRGLSLMGIPSSYTPVISVDPSALEGEIATPNERALGAYYLARDQIKLSEKVFKEAEIENDKNTVVQNYFYQIAKADALRKARMLFLNGLPPEQIARALDIEFDPANLENVRYPPSIHSIMEPGNTLPQAVASAVEEIKRKIRAGDFDDIQDLMRATDAAEEEIGAVAGPAGGGLPEEGPYARPGEPEGAGAGAAGMSPDDIRRIMREEITRTREEMGREMEKGGEGPPGFIPEAVPISTPSRRSPSARPTSLQKTILKEILTSFPTQLQEITGRRLTRTQVNKMKRDEVSTILMSFRDRFETQYNIAEGSAIS